MTDEPLHVASCVGLPGVPGAGSGRARGTGRCPPGLTSIFGRSRFGSGSLPVSPDLGVSEVLAPKPAAGCVCRGGWYFPDESGREGERAFLLVKDLLTSPRSPCSNVCNQDSQERDLLHGKVN